MKALVMGVFVVQGLLMFVDEFYFHRRRGLGRWEIWGHPVDTCSVLLLYGVALFAPLTISWVLVFLGLAIFSQLLITKDEWVHTRECEASENWLHALLFGVHPLVSLAIFMLWNLRAGSEVVLPQSLWGSLAGIELLLPGMAVLTTLTLLHQILYWNFVCPKKL